MKQDKSLLKKKRSVCLCLSFCLSGPFSLYVVLPDFARELSNQVSESKPERSDEKPHEHFASIYSLGAHNKPPWDAMLACTVSAIFKELSLKKKIHKISNTQILYGCPWHKPFSDPWPRTY